MQDYDRIPIQNIYYMLCYAWDRLKEKEQIKVGQLECEDIYNLLARILIIKLQNLIKRGFYREYNKYFEETSTLKGKINFIDSLKTFSFRKGKMYCNFEEMSHDILHNQIVKATLLILLKYKNLDKNLKDSLYGLLNYFGEISDIKLKKEYFKQIRLHKNNMYYGFILDICKLIFDNQILDETDGKFIFSDFERDDRAMAYLFENFVRNFYKRECPEFKVYRENILWATEESKRELLPIMQTDISIETKERKLIIDTKYYKNAVSNNFGSEKLINNNLYQLFAYLKNNEYKSDKDYAAKGILIYPRVDKDLNLNYRIHGHEVKICTLDLNRDWNIIYSRLMEIVK